MRYPGHRLVGVQDGSRDPGRLPFEEPTRPMEHEAADAGLYKSGPPNENTFPRIQILTIQQILDGKQPE